MSDWFARPVFHVADVAASIRFYVDKLGFTTPWTFTDVGKAHVAQVERDACALILADTWPQKAGKGLLFVSLNTEPFSHAAEAAAIDALRSEFEARGVACKDGNWGYRLLVIDDPDGNQIFFNYSNPPEAA